MNEDLLIFILEVFNRMAGPLTDQQIIDKISKEKAYFDLPSGQCYTALYYLADNKCIVWNPNPNRSENNYIINPNKNCLEFYLRRRAERLAAENPSANPSSPKKKKGCYYYPKNRLMDNIKYMEIHFLCCGSYCSRISTR